MRVCTCTCTWGCVCHYVHFSACVYVSNANAKSTRTWFCTQTISNDQKRGGGGGRCRGCLPKPIASSSRNAQAGGTLINLNAKVEWQLINLSARHRVAELNTCTSQIFTKIKVPTRVISGYRYVNDKIINEAEILYLYCQTKVIFIRNLNIEERFGDVYRHLGIPQDSVP